MDLNARVDVNFARVDVNFQTVTVTKFHYRFFFFILIPNNIKVLHVLILHTKLQQNILSPTGENGDLNSFAIFSNGGHLDFSTCLNFTVLKPWSLIMLHMKFKIHGCSGLKE